MKKHVPVHYRISAMTKTLMVSFAVLADGMQVFLLLFTFTVLLIPLSYALSLFLTLLAYSVLGLMFVSNKVNPVGGRHMVRKLTTLATTFVLEFMPILAQFMPSLIIWVILTIRQSRSEDREKAEQGAKIREERMRKDQEVMRRHAEQEAQIMAQQQSAIGYSQRESNVVPFTRRHLPTKNVVPVRPQERSSYQKAA